MYLYLVLLCINNVFNIALMYQAIMKCLGEVKEKLEHAWDPRISLSLRVRDLSIA